MLIKLKNGDFGITSYISRALCCLTIDFLVWLASSQIGTLQTTEFQTRSMGSHNWLHLWYRGRNCCTVRIKWPEPNTCLKKSFKALSYRIKHQAKISKGPMYSDPIRFPHRWMQYKKILDSDHRQTALSSIDRHLGQQCWSEYKRLFQRYLYRGCERNGIGQYIPI